LSLSRITLGALKNAIANDPNLTPEMLGHYVSEQIAFRLARVQGKGGNRRKEASALDIAEALKMLITGRLTTVEPAPSGEFSCKP
jgi:hypothetical protein